MDIVVTGRTGKLGGALVRMWKEAGDIHVQAMSRDELDLSQPEQLEEALREMSFDALVNCAAMANVEACEDNPAEAHRVNVESPGILARHCRERGARFLHFSTDYVLDGREEGLKDERCATEGLGVYAQTKLAGEELVLAENPMAVVARVSWLFATYGTGGFVESVFRRARAGEVLEAVGDKFSKPTSVREVARMTQAVLEQKELAGVFHFTHAGPPESWWSIATQVVQMAAEAGLLSELKEVRRESLENVPSLRAARPIHTAMDPARLREELNWEGPSWQDEAAELLGSM